MERDRLQSIQMLRGIAAMGVVVLHIFMIMRDHPALAGHPFFAPLPGFASFGASGVDLFFVISGFIMAHVISRSAASGAVSFLIDRAIRILPMFWLASLAYIGFMLWRGASFPLGAYINSALLVTSDAGGAYRSPALYVGWTLAFELCFYMIAAIVIALRPARPVRVLLLLLPLLAIAGTMPAIRAAAPLVFNPIMGEFALGLLAWANWNGGWRWMSRSALVIGVSVLVLIAIGPWQLQIWMHPGGVISGTSSLSRLIFLGVPYALIVAGAVSYGGGSGALSRFFERVGNASYSLYLTHPLVLEVARALLPGDARANPEMLAVALLAISVLISLQVYALVERPMLRVLRALRERAERSLGVQRRATA